MRARSDGMRAAVCRWALLPIVLMSSCRPAVPADAILVYQSGARREIDASSSHGRALLEAIDQAIARANNVLQLAVTPAFVADLREHETCVEIAFATAHTWKPAALPHYEVQARRLLVPLSGDLAGSVTTIFYDPGSGYAPGPLGVPAESSEIAGMLPMQ